MLYPKIIVALDGSAQSLRALQQAVALAETFASKLTLLHAYPSCSDLLGNVDYSSLVNERKQKGQAVLDAARSNLEPRELPVEEHLVEGAAAEALLDAVGECEASLVVMGSRGLGAMRGMLLGSVSRKVSSLAPCPVLLVK